MALCCLSSHLIFEVVLRKSACFRARVSASAHSRYPGGRGVLRDGMVVEIEVIPPGRRRGPSAANDF